MKKSHRLGTFKHLAQKAVGLLNRSKYEVAQAAILAEAGALGGTVSISSPKTESRKTEWELTDGRKVKAMEVGLPGHKEVFVNFFDRSGTRIVEASSIKEGLFVVGVEEGKLQHSIDFKKWKDVLDRFVSGQFGAESAHPSQG